MTEPIAIVGMACRFPGAPDPAAFWDLLTRGVEAVREPPPGRPELEPPSWLVEQAPSCRRGGFLDALDQFEPGFFRISPREAARMDPQQRLLLEVAWEALEDAGQPVAPLAGSTAGVFLGVMNADFARRHAQNLASIDAQLGPGSSLGIAPNRLSFFLDLRGPSMAIDTLCSSSLVAIHLACQSLAADESAPLAIAGGVNVILDRTMDVFYARAGLLSADGRCKAFDAKARGIVRGEGIGIVVLKRLSRAEADGDRIHGLILGSAVNQDGRSNGLTSPSRWSQEEVLRTAYRRAGIAPGDVSSIEAHGTGTLIGDPIETAALGAVLAEGREPGHPVALGSVKTNLGHLESAAGVAGLIKAVLSLSRRTLAPNLHFEAPNPYAKLDERGLQVTTQTQRWFEGNARPIAGVSSFGMGGTNAHVVLGGVDVGAPRASSHAQSGAAQLVAVSAQSPAALAALGRSYGLLLASGDIALDDLAYSAGARRTHHDHRRAVVASSAPEAASLLANGGGVSGRVVPGRGYTITFVFPDVDAMTDDGGHQLEQSDAAFADAFATCSAALGDSADPDIARATRAFAVQVALTATWRSLGVSPHRTIGFGVGAVTASYVEGALSLAESRRMLVEIAGTAHGDDARSRIAALTDTLGDDGTMFVEISTRPSLLDELTSIMVRRESPGVAVGSLVPGQGERTSLLRAAAELYCLGLELDWEQLGADGARYVPIPTYPWQRERCWLDFAAPATASGTIDTPARAAVAPRSTSVPEGGRSSSPTVRVTPSILEVGRPSSPTFRVTPVGAAASAASWRTLEVLVPEWQAVPRSAADVTPSSAANVLVLGHGAIAGALGSPIVNMPADAAGWARLVSERPWHDIVLVTGARALDLPDSAIKHIGRDLGRATRLVQALAHLGDAGAPRVWLVTRGAQVVGDEAPLAPLAGSALWGFGRVVANEHPRLRCTLVDLPATERIADDAAAIRAELVAAGDESEIAIRPSGRYVGRLGRKALAPPAARLQLRDDAAYLVTGGLGGLGLAAARWLVDRGARQLVLLGRRGVTTDAARTAIAEMTAAGAAVTVEQVDVADRAALVAVLAKHPVRGVIHAAGVMTPAMITALAPDDVGAMMHAKALGALHLHELTADLDFFVLYSSIATLLGMPGQAAYAASNAYLDALAEHRRAIGLPAISIAWTVIEGTGMAAAAGARALGQLADRGIGTISVARVTEVLEQVLLQAEPPATLGAVPFDLGRWTGFYPHAAAPRLALLAATSPLEAPWAREVARPSRPLVVAFGAELRSRPRGERVKALEAYLCRVAASILHHPDALDPVRSLHDLGIDSLTALELQSMVESDLEVELTTERLLRGPSLRELAVELAARLEAGGADRSPPETVAPRAPAISLRAEAALDPAITFPSRTPSTAPPAPPRSILLTGATGFLGSFLLAELLARTSASVKCLVRARNASEGLVRIEETLGRYALPALDLHARVTAIPGDLSKPQLGLSDEDFAELARSVDTIVHSGASVNFVFPYEALKAANVAGTDEILKLAAAGAARLHYVSTIGVFSGGAGSLATVFEDAPPSDPDRLALGYMRAKWVAEQRVTQAIQRGLDATIHRPGTIAGHAVTGAFNPDDFLVCMLKGCVELGLAPAVDATINMVPVDYVSRAIVDVALSTPGTTGPFHMVSPTAASWLDLVRWVRELGYPMAEVPYKEWRSVLMSRAESTGNSLVPLMPLFAAHDNTDWLRLPPYDDTRTKRALAGGGCPPIDAALIRRYVERFVVDGFMPRPR